MTPSKTLLDIHVHLAALPTADNGCHVSQAMLRKWVARYLLKKLDIDPADPVGSNIRYLSKLVGYLRDSRRVAKAVLLALDGVYNSNGEMDQQNSHFVVSNQYLLEVCRSHPNFLPGISINPLRRDALDELDRGVASGAVLVKFLPNTQGFSPADPRCRPFFRRMAEHRIPLLSHTGYEFSLMTVDQSLGDPNLLRQPLEEGVTVIAAHAGSTGLFFWEKHVATILKLVRRYPHFYLDSSALASPNRIGMALLLLRSPELQRRLLHGSDYPVPVTVRQFMLHTRPRELGLLTKESNPLDKNAGLQAALGYRFAPLPAETLLHQAMSQLNPSASG